MNNPKQYTGFFYEVKVIGKTSNHLYAYDFARSGEEVADLKKQLMSNPIHEAFGKFWVFWHRSIGEGK